MLFWLFRAETFLLGDGYTLISVFGQGESYIHKWSEPLSITLIRALQTGLGGFTRETAQTAFQLLSVLSGIISTYFFLSIAGAFSNQKRERMLVATLLFGSGAVLLFFGYVEFYSMVWACVTATIYFVLRAFHKRIFIWVALFFLIAGVSMHVQTVIVAPAVLYGVIALYGGRFSKQINFVVMFTGAIIGFSVLIWLYNTRIEVRALLLPPFTGRPSAPDNWMFSKEHLYDVFNLLFLISPAWIIISSYFFRMKPSSPTENRSIFFGIAALGSIAFVISFGAAATFGRDWDVYSIALLSPLLFLLWLALRRLSFLSSSNMIALGLSIWFVTSSFVAVSLSTPALERRFYTLLNSQNRAGWVIFANYYRLKGDEDKFNGIMQEIDTGFPSYRLLGNAYALLDKGEFESAKKIATHLVEFDGLNADFLQVVGNVYGEYGQYDSAEFYYKQALLLKPQHGAILNEYGQLLMRQGHLDSALIVLEKAHYYLPKRTFITESLALVQVRLSHYVRALSLADIMINGNPHSPGGHLIKMVVGINQGDMETARVHYLEYVKYGTKRSDYRRIRQTYGGMFE